MARLPMLITVTGPSGTGKDAVINAVLAQDPKIRRFVTATTRAPRPGEVDGVNYIFMTRAQFEAQWEAGEILEFSEHYDNKYGTVRRVVEELFAQGLDIVSDINWRGVAQLQEKMGARVFKVLVLPPSRERLEQRLTKRNPDMAAEGLARLKLIEDDLLHLHNPNHVFTNPDMAGSRYADYDVVLVNDVLDHTVAELAGLIAAERRNRGA